MNAVDDPFDLFTATALIDPYPIYEHLRRDAPLHRSRQGSVLVSRYRHVKDVLHHRSTVPVPPVVFDPSMVEPFIGDQLGELAATFSRWMTFRSGADHHALREVLRIGFRRPDLIRLEARIRSLVDEIIGHAEQAGTMDAVSDLAQPLPARVIAELLGFPPELHSAVGRWSRTTMSFFSDPTHTDTTVIAAMLDLTRETTLVIEELLEMRLRAPRDDFLTSLALARENGRIDTTDTVANILGLVFAGHETTANLISTGLYLLLRHPRQARRLHDHPNCVPTAVEEILRYESPAPTIGRIATQEFALEEQIIHAGDPLVLLLGAANRDPESFDDPDVFDIGRHPNQHLAFASGQHTCLGAPLARIEARLVFARVARWIDRARLIDDAVVWRPSLAFRGLARLPIEL
ncbi:MAG: cytochrome P450 [Acidobacteriota bacterium]